MRNNIEEMAFCEAHLKVKASSKCSELTNFWDITVYFISESS